MAQTIAKSGGFRYETGAIYIGTWNLDGLRHGFGHLQLPDNTRYHGSFKNGLFHGTGALTFSDGAKYEGEFATGWFHGYGIYWRGDGMRHEGQFLGGKAWGLGRTTFKDGSHGFPRFEGYFQDCKLLKKLDCSEAIQRAQKVAFIARNQGK